MGIIAVQSLKLSKVKNGKYSTDNDSDKGSYVKLDRVSSLDAFRGLAVILMLLGSNVGDWDHIYAPLEHAEWFGCTLADLGFPFFLFIMGASVPLSVQARFTRGNSRHEIFIHALKRSIILVTLGLTLWSLHWLAHFDYFRFYGVLQRIAIVYLALVIIVLNFPRYYVQASIAGDLLLLYLLVLSVNFLPSTLTYSSDLSLSNQLPLVPEKYHNLVDAVDTRLLEGHLYEHDENLHMGHDPEGLLSTIPAISTGLLGVLASALLSSRRIQHQRKPVYLALAGALLAVSGFLSQEVVPFSKNLWTPSFVLYTAGWSYLVLSLLYWLLDRKADEKVYEKADLKSDQKGLGPLTGLLVMYGKNPLLIYFSAACLMYITLIIRWVGQDGQVVNLKQYLYELLVSNWATPIFGPYMASSTWGVLHVAAFGALAWWLDKREIYVRI